MYLLTVWTYHQGNVDKEVYAPDSIESAEERISDIGTEYDVYKYRLEEYNTEYLKLKELNQLIELQKVFSKIKTQTICNKSLSVVEGFALSDVLTRSKFVVGDHLRNCISLVREDTIVKGFD